MHQKMGQERHEKVLLQLNPALKSLAEEDKGFQKAAPMLFGDQVEAMKAAKKSTRPGEQEQHCQQECVITYHIAGNFVDTKFCKCLKSQ